jgi:hypothetical protein
MFFLRSIFILSFCVILGNYAIAVEQHKNNPNNLPICPPAKPSAKESFGPNGKTADFKLCWGEYEDSERRYVGEFRNGFRDGLGKNVTVRGDKYVGVWRDDLPNGKGSFVSSNGDEYVGMFVNGKKEGEGILKKSNQDQYFGDFANDKYEGIGVYSRKNGYFYKGEWKLGKPEGNGFEINTDGSTNIGVFEDGALKSKSANLKGDLIVKLEALEKRYKDFAAVQKTSPLATDQSQTARKKEDLLSPTRLNVSFTGPDDFGTVSVSIEANNRLTSLSFDGQDLPVNDSGRYKVSRVARPNAITKYEIKAIDTLGNLVVKHISVERSIPEPRVALPKLSPHLIRPAPSTDALAIIIGVQSYKKLPKADFANEDARLFYDYAVRALGVKPANIKLLVDDKADTVDILGSLQSWLPLKATEGGKDIYFYFSGHGFPSEDGKELFLMPYSADRNFISRTAISQTDIAMFLEAAKPKSVTLFIDACFSGQTRSGEAIASDTRPISLRANQQTFPKQFNVFSSSAMDEISSSSVDLGHGLFSFYLMKGLEGPADVNNDGEIKLSELHEYLRAAVAKHAATLNRKQNPQFAGNGDSAIVTNKAPKK